MRRAFTMMELIFISIILSILTDVVIKSIDKADISANKQRVQKVKTTLGVEEAKTKEIAGFKSKYENVVTLNKQLQSKVKSLQKEVMELEVHLDEVNSTGTNMDSYDTGY